MVVSKGNRDGDNISDEALVVEDSLTLHDECLNDGWQEWVNPNQEHNLNVSLKNLFTFVVD